MLYDVEERRIINHLPEDMVNPLTGKRYTMAYNEGFFDSVRNAYSTIKQAFTKKNPKNNSGFDPKKSGLVFCGEMNGLRFYKNPNGSYSSIDKLGNITTYEPPEDENHKAKESLGTPTKQQSTRTTSNGQSVNQVSQNGNTATKTTYTPVGQQQAPKQPIPPRTTSGNQSSSQVNVAPSNNTSTPSTMNKKSYNKHLFSNKSTNKQQPISTPSQSATVPKQPIPPRQSTPTTGSGSANQVSQNGSTATNNTYTSTGQQQSSTASQPVTVTRTKVGEKRVVDDPNVQRVTLPDGREAIQTTSYIRVRPDKFIDRAKLAWVGAKQIFEDEMKSSGVFDKLKGLFGFGKKSVRESYNYYNNEYDDFRDHLYRK